MSNDTHTRTDRYMCSNCKEMWEMENVPLACPHCGNEVVAGYREIREVAVRPDEQSAEELPEFDEVEA